MNFTLEVEREAPTLPRLQRIPPAVTRREPDCDELRRFVRELADTLNPDAYEIMVICSAKNIEDFGYGHRSGEEHAATAFRLLEKLKEFRSGARSPAAPSQRLQA